MPAHIEAEVLAQPSGVLDGGTEIISVQPCMTAHRHVPTAFWRFGNKDGSRRKSENARAHWVISTEMPAARRHRPCGFDIFR